MPGGKILCRTFHVAVAGLELPPLFRATRVAVNVAESQGIADSHILSASDVTFAVFGRGPAEDVNLPTAALESATTVHAPLVLVAESVRLYPVAALLTPATTTGAVHETV